MQVHTSGLLGLLFVGLMATGVAGIPDFQLNGARQACIGLGITDEAKDKCADHIKRQQVNTDVITTFSYYFKSPDVQSQESHIRGAVDIARAFETTSTDRGYVVSFMTLVSDLPNRVEIIKKAQSFASMAWWVNNVLYPLGIFDSSKILADLVEHQRLQFTWVMFRYWYSTKPNSNEAFVCDERSAMAFLKYEAERHMPFDTQQYVYDAFEIICTPTRVDWNEVLQHDDLKSADEVIVMAYLKEAKQLHANWRNTLPKTWTLKSLARHVSECPDVRCVQETIKFVERYNSNLSPNCLEKLKKAAVKKAVDPTYLMSFLFLFVEDTKTEVTTCDASFPDFIMEAYDIDKEKLIGNKLHKRFNDDKTIDPMTVGVMKLHNAIKEWPYEQTKALLVALRDSGISSVDLSRYMSMELSSYVEWHLGLLRVYKATGKAKDFFFKLYTAQEDVAHIIELAKTPSDKVDLALGVYFMDKEPKYCAPETVKAIIDLDFGSFTDLMYERMFRDYCTHGKEIEEKARKIMEECKTNKEPFYKTQAKLAAIHDKPGSAVPDEKH